MVIRDIFVNVSGEMDVFLAPTEKHVEIDLTLLTFVALFSASPEMLHFRHAVC